MGASNVTSMEGNTFSSTRKVENEASSKFKALGFAVLIILGVGGLAVAGVGTGGLLQAGSLANLGQVNSIVMIVVGGAGSIPLLVIGIIGFVKTCSGFSSRVHGKTAIQDTKHSTLEGSEGMEHEQEKIEKTDEERVTTEENILNTLIECASQEDEAYLIDFSKINPSNIFKIINSKDHHKASYGDVVISDCIDYDESSKFTHNFPFKYSISIVSIEKNEHGYTSSSSYNFTMNEEGKVESYGQVFDNFDVYLESKMRKNIYAKGQWCTFEHFDFESAFSNSGRKKLRKKSSSLG